MGEFAATVSIKVAPVVDVSGCLLGLAQDAVSRQENVQIELQNENGEAAYVVILPGRREYLTNVTDGKGFYQTPATQFKVTRLGAGLPERFRSDLAKRLEDLLWRAAYHVSEGRLIEGCTVFDVVRLRRWPNLTRLPSTPNTFRIFALLTRHPTSIGLVHRMLHITKDEVFQVISAAYCAGLIEKVSCNVDLINKMQQEAEQTLPETKEHGFFRSLLAKITGL